MEKVTTKKLALYSGRTHPDLAEEVAELLERLEQSRNLGQNNRVDNEYTCLGAGRQRAGRMLTKRRVGSENV